MKASWFGIFMVALLSIGIAATCSGQTQPVAPEIDAGAGMTALTLVAGAMLWVQQVRRR